MLHTGSFRMPAFEVPIHLRISIAGLKARNAPNDWCIVSLGIWNGLSPCLGLYKKGNGVAVYLHLTTYVYTRTGAGTHWIGFPHHRQSAWLIPL